MALASLVPSPFPFLRALGTRKTRARGFSSRSYFACIPSARKNGKDLGMRVGASYIAYSTNEHGCRASISPLVQSKEVVEFKVLSGVQPTSLPAEISLCFYIRAYALKRTALTVKLHYRTFEHFRRRYIFLDGAQ